MSTEIQSTRDFHLRSKEQSMLDEMSVSYLLRGVDGKSDLIKSGLGYGPTLGRALLDKVTKLPATSSIINLGDGLGYNTAGITETWNKKGVKAKVINLDLSPALLRAQRTVNPSIPMVQADAVRLPFGDNQLNGIISNEMIADLPSIIVDGHKLADRVRYVKERMEDLVEENTDHSKLIISKDKLGKLLKDGFLSDDENLEEWCNILAIYVQYDLPLPKINSSQNDSNKYTINIGAIHLIEEVARTLKPGAWAWISETGSPNEEFQPIKVELKNHNEYSINFDILAMIAKKLNLNVNIEPLNDALEIDRESWFVEHDDGNVALFLGIKEAINYFPEKYRGRPMIPFRRNEIDTRTDSRLKELEERLGIKIQHLNDSVRSRGESETDNASRPVFIEKLGDVTDQFYVLSLRKRV